MEAFEQSYVVYGMNGKRLPLAHGYPVHWGEVNVKWLDRIEFTDEDVEGYWEGAGEVSGVVKLWTVEQQADGVLLGGRGVARRRGHLAGRDAERLARCRRPPARSLRTGRDDAVTPVPVYS